MEYVKQDVRTGQQYELQGDYYLIAGEGDDAQPSIGIWGQWHLRWLKRNRRVTYTNLLACRKLYAYLADIDQQANEQFDLLVEQMAIAEGITEQFKATDQIVWVQRMNSIRDRAEEILLKDIIVSGAND